MGLLVAGLVVLLVLLKSHSGINIKSQVSDCYLLVAGLVVLLVVLKSH